jgi:ATP-dependent DNA helicase UvrD/PcrA
VRLIVERLDFLNFITSAFEWIGQQESKLAGQNPEGYADYADDKTSWEELQKATIEKFGREELTLNTMLQEFDLSEKSPPIPPDAVKCLTIHTAKGMEFHHVFLVGLAEDQLPSFQSSKKGGTSREMQEERRNCFVAITRTQESLTLTYADSYFGWNKEPSRFLREMGLVT